MITDLPKPDYARNISLIGYSEQGGRPDGVQIMVHRGHAYIGHMFSKGFGELSRSPSGHLEYSSPDPRRSAAGDQRQGHEPITGAAGCCPPQDLAAKPRPVPPTSRPHACECSRCNIDFGQASTSERLRTFSRWQ
jgi:hypothetical protein